MAGELTSTTKDPMVVLMSTLGAAMAAAQPCCHLHSRVFNTSKVMSDARPVGPSTPP